MAILNIRIIGDPVLRTVADPVTEFGPELAKLVADMTETMEDVEGAGLAAPQIGVSRRVFTYRVGGVDGHVINPVLENSDDYQPDHVEGCLSIPGLGFPVRRFRATKVTGVDLHGILPRPGGIEMQKLKIEQGDWIVVCDGKKALVMENVGDEKFLNLKTREVFEHSDPKTREMGTDAPGRSFNSVGHSRGAME